MVGEEVLKQSSDTSTLQKGTGKSVVLKSKGNFERSPHPVGFTYFIRVDDAIKIGSASNFKHRLHALQTAHEKPLEVLAVVPAGLADEFAVHQLFDGLRVRGEWFRADQELLHFIEGLKAQMAELPAMQPSPPVPVTREQMTIDRARRQLYTMRVGRPGDDPLTHRIHNLLEQLTNYEKAESDDQRSNLKRGMACSVRDIKHLSAPQLTVLQ